MSNEQILEKSKSKSLVKAKDFSEMKSSDIAKYFDMFSLQIERALPKHLTAERMLQMAVTTISRNEKLKKCSTKSMIGAIMQASILGFQPVDALGECYIIPYNGEAQFQIGYKGYLSLMWRSGKVKNVYANVIYKSETRGVDYDVEYGTNSILWHKPSFNIDRNINSIGLIYAGAKLLNGGEAFIVMDIEQIDALRKRNPFQKGAPTGAWKTDFEAMAKAKAFKQLIKLLPISTEFANVIESDEKILTPESFENGQILIENVEEAENFEDDTEILSGAENVS